MWGFEVLSEHQKNLWIKHKIRQTWSLNPHKLLHEGTLVVFYHDSTCCAEVSIEPRVPQSASVGLHANLYKAFALFLTDWFDAKRWGIGTVCDLEVSVSTGEWQGTSFA